MPGDSGPLQSPNPVTRPPLFMSDGEDANDRGEIDERDRIRKVPGSGATNAAMSSKLSPSRRYSYHAAAAASSSFASGSIRRASPKPADRIRYSLISLRPPKAATKAASSQGL
jgi:hypothetical protein